MKESWKKKKLLLRNFGGNLIWRLAKIVYSISVKKKKTSKGSIPLVAISASECSIIDVLSVPHSRFPKEMVQQ